MYNNMQKRKLVGNGEACIEAHGPGYRDNAEIE